MIYIKSGFVKKVGEGEILIEVPKKLIDGRDCS